MNQASLCVLFLAALVATTVAGGSGEDILHRRHPRKEVQEDSECQGCDEDFYYGGSPDSEFSEEFAVEDDVDVGSPVGEVNTGGESSCKVIFNTDMPGEGRINDGRVTFTASDEECCTLCNDTPECKAWTRISKDTEYNKEGQCWMRDVINGFKRTNFTNSGIKPGSKEPSCNLLEGVDFPGGGTINDGQYFTTESDEECCALCDAVPNCKVWTRITVDTEYNRKGQCWLRETVNKHKKTNFTNSGVKEDLPELQSGQESDQELGASKLKPSAKRPQCSFVWGVELSREGVINDGKKVNATSEFECCALCNRTPGCKAWTRIIKPAPKFGHLRGECWLMNTVGEQREVFFANSGIKADSNSANHESSCIVLHGADLAGGGTINDGREAITDSESDCCAYCDMTPGCKAWTRISREIPSNREGQCWLYNRRNSGGTTNFTNSGAMPGARYQQIHA